MEDLAAARRVRVVMATSREEDREAIEAALAGTPWEVVHVWEGREVLRSLQHVAVPIVLYDTAFAQLEWQVVLRGMLRTRRRTCVILIADVLNRELSAEVARVGAFDVLTRPFEQEQIVATLLGAYTQARSGLKALDSAAPAFCSLRIERSHC